MNKTFREQLIDWERKYNKRERKKKKSSDTCEKCADCKCKNKDLTNNEFLDLMGVHRPIYVRGRGGAFKQK